MLGITVLYTYLYARRIQAALNFLIPSGSAQAVVSMPVMIPLGELAGFAALSMAVAIGRGPF